MNPNISAMLATVAIALASTSISSSDITKVAEHYGIDPSVVSSLAQEMMVARKVAYSDMKNNN